MSPLQAQKKFSQVDREIQSLSLFKAVQIEVENVDFRVDKEQQNDDDELQHENVAQTDDDEEKVGVAFARAKLLRRPRVAEMDVNSRLLQSTSITLHDERVSNGGQSARPNVTLLFSVLRLSRSLFIIFGHDGQ